MRVRPTPHGGGRGASHCAQLIGGVTETVFTPSASAEVDASGHAGRLSVPDESRSGECKGCVAVVSMVGVRLIRAGQAGYEAVGRARHEWWRQRIPGTLLSSPIEEVAAANVSCLLVEVASRRWAGWRPPSNCRRRPEPGTPRRRVSAWRLASTRWSTLAVRPCRGNTGIRGMCAVPRGVARAGRSGVDEGDCGGCERSAVSMSGGIRLARSSLRGV